MPKNTLIFSMSRFSILLYTLALFLLSGCATYAPQYLGDDGLEANTLLQKRNPHKTFYLIGDAGGSKKGKPADALVALKKVLDTAQRKEDYVIFLGDNIYDKGMPKKDAPKRQDAQVKIDAQVNVVKDFKGEVLFIPGNHDWYAGGLGGLKRQEDYLEEALNNKNVFQPEDGCPIEKIDVSNDITLLLLDTQWYLEDWDEHPTINDECDIKTRKDFFLEIEGEFKKNNEKTIIVAMHHPMFTNGTHNGKYPIDKHLFPFQSRLPLPGLASLVTQIRSKGGVSIQDRTNKKYSSLMDRLATLARDTNKAIFVSGHEHSLQYLDSDGIKQIVSGAGAKQSAATLGSDGLFAYGGQGFAILDIYEDGSSQVAYYAARKGEPSLLFSQEIHPAWKNYDTSKLPTTFNTTTKATAYEPNETNKGKSHDKFWGVHYRKVYGTEIEVPVVTLDTLMGGFTVDRKGGGHQTRSLRLVSPDGKNYAMRAVKKSAVQFLQSVVFKDNFVQEEFRDTFTEDVITDFYTASHPFASLAVGDLADALEIYHTNPQLVWMPKHPALGKYNESYGDELYIIEERPDNGFIDVASFGKPDKIESTADMLKNIRKDEEYRMDEAAYVRARLFDMLLGDWDRHADQWRWARFDKNGKKTYKPIPRDRDQIFSNYDGTFLDIIKTLIPSSRMFQEYSGDLKDIKWINIGGSKLDHALIPNATLALWIDQAQFIKQNLSDEIIEKAFLKFPKEVQTAQLEDIKAKLKQRREHMVDIATRYYKHLNKLVILKGTDKDDHFEITRETAGTRIKISRIKDDQISPPFINRLIKPSETKEVWLYGLDDDDSFLVSGKGKSPVSLRIVGGQNNDKYTINDGRRVKIYDHKTKPNIILKKGGANVNLSNIYTKNTYDINKTINRVNTVLPSIGFNPDDGFIFGLQDTYLIKGFKNNPFHQKHTIKAGYYTATSGLDASYQGEFANTFGKWNLLLGGRITSDSYALNFFGFGNETINLDDDLPLGLDFNRVRTGQSELQLAIVKDNHYDTRFKIGAHFRSIEVEDTPGRFISEEFGMTNPDFFNRKNFIGIETGYHYHSTNNDANPSRGMLFDLVVGSTLNLQETDRVFGYVQPQITFYNALTRNKKWVLKTQAQGHFNIGNDFEFYQAATAGASTGLRGFRNQRFTGKSAFVGSADIRYSFNRVRTGLLPIQLGLYGGADVGRVWLDGEDSTLWHDSLGGGFWVNAVDMISGQFGLFSSDDGLRVNFGFGVQL